MSTSATQRALLKAVAANPHDDTPRLVYADWLDEHAAELPKKEREATAAAAEIIRVQCELARLADEDCDERWIREYLAVELNPWAAYVDWSEIAPRLTHHFGLRSREADLYSRYADNWKKAECVESDGVSLGLSHGFWTALSLRHDVRTVGPVIRLLKRQPSPIPVSDLYCECELASEQAEELVSSGVLAHLATIGGSLQRPLFTALGESTAAASIQEANLQLADDSVALPFSRKGWSGLRALRVMLHGEQGHLTSMTQVARAKHLAALHTINIDLDGWCETDTVRAVADGNWKQLRRLDFQAFLIDDGRAHMLASGTALRELRYLRLGREVGGEGATALLKSSTLRHLVVLDLNHNVIRGLDASSLRYAERPHLRVLSLASANSMPTTGKRGLSKADLVTVAKTPATQHLQILDLASNELTDPATTAFLGAMKMQQLAVLNMEYNRELGPQTAEALAGCAQLDNLQALTLAGTKIGNAGAKALAKSKHLGKLRYLDVTNAGVTASGLAALRKRFGEDVVRG